MMWIWLRKKNNEIQGKAWEKQNLKKKKQNDNQGFAWALLENNE